jgi:hypothetical protein
MIPKATIYPIIDNGSTQPLDWAGAFSVEFQRGEFHAVQCYRYQALRTAKKGQHRIADLLQGRGWEVEIVSKTGNWLIGYQEVL